MKKTLLILIVMLLALNLFSSSEPPPCKIIGPTSFDSIVNILKLDSILEFTIDEISYLDLESDDVLIILKEVADGVVPTSDKMVFKHRKVRFSLRGSIKKDWTDTQTYLTVAEPRNWEGGKLVKIRILWGIPLTQIKTK
jgi:hypothetical protein